MLRARAIELAERANRLKNRADSEDIQDIFDHAADTLIEVDKPERFYLAQTKLESENLWSEEMRSLAHEINMADQASKGTSPISFESSVNTLQTWNQSYLNSSNPEVMKISLEINIALLNLKNPESEYKVKEALEYLLSFIEALLSHIHSTEISSLDNPTIILLRNMRDATLIRRELIIDKSELDRENNNQNINNNRIQLTRESLDEIYSTLKPV